MRLLLSLPVLLVALCTVLEGPAPAQAAPDFQKTLETIPEKLKELGHTLEDKARTAFDHIKKSEIPAKTKTWFSNAFKKVRDTFADVFS
ncbi:apolipoprotein C-I [Choloepus didactylus]|uniref:apolipoprotein C-I n=1 Tax=Choloepus didactylus TaxID=27675 RepID=UPI00189CE43A|nr:apolipoprotein C-I [Choloepus didactylus]